MHKNNALDLSHHSGATVTAFFMIFHPHLPYLHFKNNNKCHFLEKFSAAGIITEPLSSYLNFNFSLPEKKIGFKNESDI